VPPPQNPPDSEKNSQCKFRWAHGSEAAAPKLPRAISRTEAAARHQDRSQRMMEKFRGFIQL